jgi:F-type H+-transporting ATPase subunit b
MIVINLLILYIILKKYFWEKIRKFMQDRENAVRDAFDSAEAMNKRADEKMRNYSARIAGVEEEGREIIRQAKQQADAQAQDILAEARQQASEIIQKAEKTIELEKAKAMEEMRQEIGTLALMAAEKIVGKEIEDIGQDAIVDDVIKQARSGGWQN